MKEKGGRHTKTKILQKWIVNKLFLWNFVCKLNNSGLLENMVSNEDNAIKFYIFYL